MFDQKSEQVIRRYSEFTLSSDLTTIYSVLADVFINGKHYHRVRNEKLTFPKEMVTKGFRIGVMPYGYTTILEGGQPERDAATVYRYLLTENNSNFMPPVVELSIQEVPLAAQRQIELLRAGSLSYHALDNSTGILSRQALGAGTVPLAVPPPPNVMTNGRFWLLVQISCANIDINEACGFEIRAAVDGVPANDTMVLRFKRNDFIWGVGAKYHMAFGVELQVPIIAVRFAGWQAALPPGTSLIQVVNSDQVVVHNAELSHGEVGIPTGIVN